MPNKVILLDASVMSFKAAFQAELAAKYKKGDTFILPSHYTYFSSIISCLKKINVEENDIVILAIDDKSWRKNYYAPYKAQRKEAREKHIIDWDEHFSRVNQVNQQIAYATPFHVIRVPGAEADDLISVACRAFKDKEVVIASIDCMSGNTKVRLAVGGSKCIRDIKVGEEVLSYDTEKKCFSKSKVVNHIQKNHKVRYKIYHEGCKAPLNSSANHLFFTKKGWKKAEDLKVGDILYHAKERIFPINNQQNNYKLGYLLGLIDGDGSVCYNTKSFQIELCDKEPLERVKKYLKDLFNYDVTILKTKLTKADRQCYKINVYLNYRFDYLINKINLKSNTFYKGYCAGFYDAEGSLNENEGFMQISFYQNKFKLLRRIKKFLKQLNVKSNKIFMSCKECNKLTLNSEESIKFLHLCKPAILRKYPSWKYHSLHLQNGYKITKIKLAKTNFKEFRDFDISVEPYHNYVIEGNVIVHNSDLQQLCYYPNVKIFNLNFKTSKGKGGYVKITQEEALNIIERKIKKGDASDNILISPDDDENDVDLRRTIINLLELPHFVECPIAEVFATLPHKTEIKWGELPFQNSLAKRFQEIYDPQFKIDYNYCVKLKEKRVIKKKKKETDKRKEKKNELSK